MPKKRFLEPGSPLVTIKAIEKANRKLTIENPEDMTGDFIPPDSFARIRTSLKGICTVLVYDEESTNTLIVEVPEGLMKELFKQTEHELFPHIA